MAHQRKLIRDAVLLALTGVGPAFATAAGARVYNNRVAAWPLRLLELGPCLSVYAVEESTEPSSRTTAPKRLQRNLQLAVEGAVVAGPGGDVDDSIDALCVEVERAMHRDPTFGGTCGESILASTAIEVTSEGKTEIGNVRLVYDVTYYTLAPDPADVALDDLELLEANIDLGGTTVEADQQLAEVDFTDPSIYLDSGVTRPAEHADPQALTFDVSELLALGEELWIDATATTTVGQELLAHTVEISHVATAALIKTSVIAPAAGRILGGFNTADLTALAITGYFRIDLKDSTGAVFDTLHFTLNA